MPFKKPWARYRSGDILYGLTDDRHKAAIEFEVKPNDVYTIDQYSTIRPILRKDNDGLFPYRSDESKTVYNPKFIEQLERNEKTKKIVDTDVSPSSKGAKNWNSDFLGTGGAAKRKSKAGLKWITSLEGSDVHIHFILSGINQEEVTKKSYILTRKVGLEEGITHFQLIHEKRHKPGSNWDKKYRSITGAELRWIYRHRYNKNVQAKIQFWDWDKKDKKFFQCGPPWESSATKNFWASYKPVSEPDF